MHLATIWKPVQEIPRQKTLADVKKAEKNRISPPSQVRTGFMLFVPTFRNELHMAISSVDDGIHNLKV